MKALQRYQMSKTEEAALKAEIARQVHELDEKFSSEICAMLLWALHEEFGFGADRLRRVWDCVAVHRAELLKHYDMQDNAEFILLLSVYSWCFFTFFLLHFSGGHPRGRPVS